MRPDYTPKVPWTIGKFHKRIREVENDMKLISKNINAWQHEINEANHWKKTNSLHYSKKAHYLKLLKQDLEELKAIKSEI